MRELAKYDEEDDGAGDPGPEPQVTHNSVAEGGDEPCRRNYDDASLSIREHRC